ncbi:MAG: cytochrome c oxidase subunit II [Thermoleophilaceae bacterium]|nr:cytochrome c oxidase subunit II [Thermoleophilaceae bacterium]
MPDDVVAGPFTPDAGGSPNAGDIDRLYRIALYIGIVVFLVVEGTLIWSIWRYRRRRGRPPAAQIRGNAPLEVGWTVGAALIVVVLAVVTFIYLDDIQDLPGPGPGTLAGATQVAAAGQPSTPPDGRPLNIDVNGLQFLWRYDYPGREPLYTFYEMVVPTDTTVTLDITSSDVVHSWWIPVLGGKADATPGYTNHTWFRISTKGVYRGVCAELCGYNHADMRAAVRAVSPARFSEWARRKRAQIRRAGEALAAERRARGEGP